MSFALLDGGMGQELVRRAGKPATPLWSAELILDRPELVEAAHADFLEAGAEVITLSAYSATPARLEKHGRGDAFGAIHAASVSAAQRARDTVRPSARIAGCLPPLTASYRPGDRLPEAEAEAHYDRIVGAQRDGVDLFLCETLPSVEEARIATRAAVRSGKPVWTALTVSEEDGARLRSGEPVADGAKAAVDEGAEAVLINCSPPEKASEALAVLADVATRFGAYANGFTTVTPLIEKGTVDALESRRDLDPDAYAAFVRAWLDQGAAIVGGCCEITPAHIARLGALRAA